MCFIIVVFTKWKVLGVPQKSCDNSLAQIHCSCAPVSVCFVSSANGSHVVRSVPSISRRAVAGITRWVPALAFVDLRVSCTAVDWLSGMICVRIVCSVWCMIVVHDCIAPVHTTNTPRCVFWQEVAACCCTRSLRWSWRWLCCYRCMVRTNEYVTSHVLCNNFHCTGAWLCVHIIYIYVYIEREYDYID